MIGPDLVLDEIAHVDFAGSAWRKDLLRSKPPMNTNAEGRILPVLANAIAAFRRAPEPEKAPRVVSSVDISIDSGGPI